MLPNWRRKRAIIQNHWPPLLSPHNEKLLKKEFIKQTCLNTIKPFACLYCSQIFMSKEMLDNQICNDCYSSQSREVFDLGDIPDCLKDLTYPEKICIAR